MSNFQADNETDPQWTPRPTHVPSWHVEITYAVDVRASDPREAVAIAELKIQDGRAEGKRVDCERIYTEVNIP